MQEGDQTEVKRKGEGKGRPLTACAPSSPTGPHEGSQLPPGSRGGLAHLPWKRSSTQNSTDLRFGDWDLEFN